MPASRPRTRDHAPDASFAALASRASSLVARQTLERSPCASVMRGTPWHDMRAGPAKGPRDVRVGNCDADSTQKAFAGGRTHTDTTDQLLSRCDGCSYLPTQRS